MVKFSSDSSIHGIKFIFGPKQSKIERIFWIFWFLLSVLCFAYCIYDAALRWFVNPEVTVKVKEKPIREFPFPAVTVCSPVFAKHSIVDFQVADEPNEDLKPYTKKECEYILANSHWCLHPNLYSTVYHCPEDENQDLDVVKLINESSASPSELFQKVPYRKFIDSNEEPLSPLAKFDKVLTDQGFCYTTNLQNHHVIFRDGISEDFDSYKRKIILKSSNPFVLDRKLEVGFNDTEQWTLEDGYPNTDDETFPVRAMRRHSALIIPKLDDADLSNICNEQQFSLIFHLPNEIPTPLHKFYPLEYGSMKKFRVSVLSQKSDEAMRGFTPQRRDCYFDGERQLKFFKTYTKAHCDWECMTNFTLETCGCVKFSMPRDNQTRVCSLLESKCYVEAMDSWPKYSKSEVEAGKPCDCLSTCTDIKYGVEVQIDSTFNKRQQGKFTSWAEIGVSDYVAVVQESVVNYKVSNFIADSGGLLAIFLGCSLLSFIELIYFGLAALIKRARRRNTKVHAFIERFEEKEMKPIKEKKPKKRLEVEGMQKKMRKMMRYVMMLRKNKNEVVKV